MRLGGKDIALVQETDLSTKNREKTVLNELYKKAYAVLEKTYYQIIVTDQTFVSVLRFLTYVEDMRQMKADEKVNTTITKEVMGSKKSSISSSSPDIAQTILLKGETAVAPPVKSAVAEKMMKMMGWTEGMGLGTAKQGIVEPIK